MDAGALYTHFYYVTMHLLCIKNTYISPIHRGDLQDMSYPLAPIWELAMFEFGGGGEDAANCDRVFTFYFLGQGS